MNNPVITVRVFTAPSEAVWVDVVNYVQSRLLEGSGIRCCSHVVTASLDRPSETEQEILNEWLIEQGVKVGERVWVRE